MRRNLHPGNAVKYISNVPDDSLDELKIKRDLGLEINEEGSHNIFIDTYFYCLNLNCLIIFSR
jgi:hypothetical protein